MATLQNALGTNTADVNGSFELAVALSKVLANAGYASLLGEEHDGASGLPALRRSIHASIEKRLGIAQDALLWDDAFNVSYASSPNVRKYWAGGGLTVVETGGLLTLNASGLTSTTAAYSLRSYRSFPLFGNFPTITDFWFSLALLPQANNNIEIGLGIPSGISTNSPTDGVYMLIDTAGALQLVSNQNGATTSSGAITLPAGLAWTASRVYHGELVIHADRAELYFDSILIGTVLRSAAPTFGGLSQQQGGFLFARLNNAAATTGAQKLNLSRWAVTLGDGGTVRPWPLVRVGLGDNLFSVPDGVAVAALDNVVNSTAPTSATLSNTAAGYTTLGGNFQFAAVAGVEIDFALFSYQVPALAAAQQAKTAVITGIEIDAFNMGAAVATTPTLLNWYICSGATAASLATTDTASTRAPHRKFLGAQSFPVGAAIGARADRNISVDFSSGPVIAEAGTFVTIVLRMPVGTATASQIIRGGVTVKGYFE